MRFYIADACDGAGFEYGWDGVTPISWYLGSGSRIPARNKTHGRTTYGYILPERLTVTQEFAEWRAALNGRTFSASQGGLRRMFSAMLPTPAGGYRAQSVRRRRQSSDIPHQRGITILRGIPRLRAPAGGAVMRRIQVTVTRLFPSGAVECTAMVNGYLVRRVYYGYSNRDAARLFRAEVAEC